MDEIKRWMRAELQNDIESYLDCDGATVLRTQLGEAYADAHDLDEDIPDDVWDAAHEVGVWWEEAA